MAGGLSHATRLPEPWKKSSAREPQLLQPYTHCSGLNKPFTAFNESGSRHKKCLKDELHHARLRFNRIQCVFQLGKRAKILIRISEAFRIIEYIWRGLCNHQRINFAVWYWVWAEKCWKPGHQLGPYLDDLVEPLRRTIHLPSRSQKVEEWIGFTPR